MSRTKRHPSIQQVRLLATITVHYGADKLRFLAEAIRALSEMAVARLDLVIVTNTTNAGEIEEISRQCRYFLDAPRWSIRSFPDLSDPFLLPWCHKEPVLRDRFVKGDEGHTHFIYLEDDMRFTHRNLTYYLWAREFLRPHGLLPGFLRVEYNGQRNHYTAVDYFDSAYIEELRRVPVKGGYFISPPYPYCAMYLLDRETAAEHVGSSSFTLEASKDLIWWHTRERANMGQCYSDIPEGFSCRHVLPVDAERLEPVSECWVTHLANTYALGDQPFGRLTVSEAFRWSRSSKFPAEKEAAAAQ